MGEKEKTEGKVSSWWKRNKGLVVIGVLAFGGAYFGVNKAMSDGRLRFICMHRTEL